MSLCKSCGKDVLWAKRHDGRTHPPIQSVGQVLIVDVDGIVQRVTGYERHVCDPEDMKRYEVELNEQRALNDQYAINLAAAWEHGIDLHCTECDSAPGERCYNLKIWRKDGNKVHTVWPHQSRLPKAPKGPEVTPEQ